MSGGLEGTREGAEEEIGKESEECGGNGAGENEGIADQGDAAEDKCAEAAGADGGGDGSDADGDDGGGANSGENDGERERETDAEEDLRTSHAHGFGGFEDGGIDAGKANVGVAQDGEQRIEDERDNGGALANAGERWGGDWGAAGGEAWGEVGKGGGAQSRGWQGGPL